MFMSNNYLDRVCRYVDIPDKDFFLAALNKAIEIEPDLETCGIDKAELKRRCPIVHVSCLSKQTKDEVIVTRREVHGPRARRRFLSMDVDYEPGQEAEAQDVRDTLISLCSEQYGVPILIYPTMSYPEKPRFRVIIPTQRALDFDQHWQAMRWLYGCILRDPTDESDLRMNVNRNLPLFNSPEQVAGVYETLSDPDLEPLPSRLWAKEEKPPKRDLSDLDEIHADSEHAEVIPSRVLSSAVRELLTMEVTKSYQRFWPLVNSFAAAARCGGITYEEAGDAMDELADAAPDAETRERWRSGNRRMLDQAMRSMDDPAKLARTRPLSKWHAFEDAARQHDEVVRHGA